MDSEKAPAARIPQPPTKPLVGNVADIDPKAPIQSMMRLAAEYGPIVRLTLAGRSFYVVSSQALVDELCDETRFNKRLHGPLLQIRAFAGDGLFTAFNSEPNWGKAHRLLMPAFGPVGVRGMWDRMVDIAHQMFEKWERFGPGARIDVADNMTRLTLDTIALCAFDYRFNSFYRDEMHPFVEAMVDALDEAGQRTRQLEVVTQLKLGARRRYEASQATLARVADELIAERRSDPDGAAKSDLLNVMLNGVDPVTGEKLPDENIRHQMVTFLIAGHETTSGLLSFACYLLLKNPAAMLRAQQLCDEVMGGDMPRLEHLGRLRFLEQILMESLRLWPTAPAFAVKPIEPTLLAGRHPMTPADTLLVLAPMLHRDPAVWGDDAEAFRPERFEPEAAAQLPPNAWKPFGNGARACIGRAFAMQEAQLVLAMLLQRFDIVMADPSYTLEIAETLTLKPHGLEIRARRRGTARHALARPASEPPQRLRGDVAAAEAPPLPADAPRLVVLYGSNTGSCEMFARRIAADAARHGVAATVAAMDDHAEPPPAGSALVVVTASYEGQAPDNARRFVAWLEGAGGGRALDGVPCAVFGCGNRQWARTYQQVPKRVEALLAAAGARAFRARGEADAGGDFFGAFDEWYAGLWHDLDAALGRAHPAATTLDTAPRLDVEVLPAGRATALQLHELQTGTLAARRELVDLARPGARSKLHLQIALPAGMTYRCGDYLAVLPRNPDAGVMRVLRRFGLTADSQLLIRKPATGALPAGYPVGAMELFSGYVELAQPATRAQVAQLAAVTACPPERQRLARLAEEPAYSDEVLGGRLAVIDLLEEAASCTLGLAAFLAMLPPMRPRQYSISSSPLAGDSEASLTIAVVDAPALSGRGRFAGVASSYLSRLAAGDRVAVAVRPSQSGFRPPADPATPMVMVCAGTGVAPFRGFLQERAIQKAAGREVGPALLFFGIDHPEVDFLYRDEFAAWAERGVVDLRMAYSAEPQDGIVFVQDRLWRDRAEVQAMFEAGAQFYVCGDGKRMAPAVRDTFVRIYQAATHADDAAADAWANRMEHEHGRYVSDVFA